MRSALRTLAVLCCVAGLGTFQSAPAAEGALEINQDCVAAGCFSGDAAAFPVTITQPGRYILTSDLAVSGDVGATIGVLIQASPVDLDLNGFTVDGGGACSGNPASSCSGAAAFRGVQVSSSNRLVRIRNGSVTGFGNDGIEIFSAADGSLLEDLVVSENGAIGVFLSGSSNASLRIHRVASTRNLLGGVLHSTSGRLVVNDSVFSNNGDYGLTVNTRAVIQGSSFLFNDGFGVVCAGICALGQSAFLDNNTASATSEFSIVTLRDMGGNVCEDGACP